MINELSIKRIEAERKEVLTNPPSSWFLVDVIIEPSYSWLI
jgi:hypothetical protein